MSGFRLRATRLFQPSPAQGECITVDPSLAAVAWGRLQALSQSLLASPFGQVSRQVFRWRGRVPDGVAPAPGWEAEIDGERYRVTGAARMIGRTWRLELERMSG